MNWNRRSNRTPEKETNVLGIAVGENREIEWAEVVRRNEAGTWCTKDGGSIEEDPQWWTGFETPDPDTDEHDPWYVVEWIGGNCPVQAEGTCTGGRRFYFRGRHDSLQMTVSLKPAEGDYLDWGTNDEDAWYYEQDYAAVPYAGWIGHDTARAFIEWSIRKFVADVLMMDNEEPSEETLRIRKRQQESKTPWRPLSVPPREKVEVVLGCYGAKDMSAGRHDPALAPEPWRDMDGNPLDPTRFECWRAIDTPPGESVFKRAGRTNKR